MSRTKGIALPGKSMEEATRNAQKDFLSKNPKAVDSATVKSGAEKSPIVSEPSHKDRKIFMQFMKPQNGNSGGNLQNVIRKNL